MKPALLTCLLSFALAAPWALATPNTPPPPQREPLLLRNATLHPVTGPVVTGGSLLIEAGKIRAIGGADLAAPAGARVIDLDGRHVYPGLVAANSSLGLAEIRSVNASTDTAETGPLNPNARALVAFNADSELLPVTRGGGVLTALSVPEAGRTGLIAGTSALLQLEGWNWQDMALVPEFDATAFDPEEPHEPKFGAVDPRARGPLREFTLDGEFVVSEDGSRRRVRRDGACPPRVPRRTRRQGNVVFPAVWSRNGGGGGNRTRVRSCSIAASTCVAF